ncbi:MAG: HupE/UreJ family protein [Phycisphaerales bacterium]|nr:HupE/UreJ family protein [Phycisphaerales bacterium]
MGRHSGCVIPAQAGTLSAQWTRACAAAPERVWWRAAAFVVAFCCAASAFAHDFSITRVTAVIKQDGSYLIDLRIDVDALALGAAPNESSEEIEAALRALTPTDLALAETQVKRTIQRFTRVRVDGLLDDPRVDLPEHGVEPPPGSPPSVFGTIARLSGHMPLDAKEFSFAASRAFNAVDLTILEEEALSGARFTLSPGAESPPYLLHESKLRTADSPLARYLVLGFEHIVPKGLDHILFVLGLFLLSIKTRALLWQVTAFTVAHSITLALSMASIASLPPRVVEPLIALSIAYVAIENLCVRELKPWRPAVVFAFGLLHGMGFAGVLRELGLPPGQFVPALVGFNLGVEAGQLAVIATAFVLVGWFRNRDWYRKAIILPASALIAAVGLYWAVERALGMA